jgi:GTPase
MSNIELIKLIKEQYPKLFVTEITDDEFVLEPEQENGYVEYKLTLTRCTDKKATKYATQMRWRIIENIKNQSAIYFIGVNDDGRIIGLNDDDALKSIQKFISIAETIDASVVYVKLINVKSKLIVQICVKNKKIRDNYLVDFD